MTVTHGVRAPGANIAPQIKGIPARARRVTFRARRRFQRAGEHLAERLRPATVDGGDLGRLSAAMTVSGAFIALLLFALTAFLVELYAPVARAALHAMGFDV